MKNLITTLALALLLPLGSKAAAIFPDQSPERLDSARMALFTRNANKIFNEYFEDFARLDPREKLKSDTPDSVYKARLAAILSPIQMPWNEITKQFIISYTTKRRGTMATVLARSQYYFPIIEQELAAAGLPLEFRMLPVVESALAPTAKSRAGAMGLWQFMYSTGKAYGLEITTYVDMRCDPDASTRAACRFLKDLYKMYKDWTLVLAAYNCGPGNVNKALRLATEAADGKKAETYWDIYDFLPKETRDYVPAFIASTYAYNYHKQYDIEMGAAPETIAIDTVMVDKLTHLSQVATTLSLSLETLQFLNPEYLQDIVPALDKPYPLVLPMEHISRFVSSKDAIHAKQAEYLADYLDPKNIDETRAKLAVAATTHRVKSGETLGAIARKYSVTEKQIIRWNNLKNPNRLSIGQKLEIQK
jgi:membrane-bound lytic murein transglycosylase D